jgi:hypothetical protein
LLSFVEISPVITVLIVVEAVSFTGVGCGAGGVGGVTGGAGGVGGTDGSVTVITNVSVGQLLV